LETAATIARALEDDGRLSKSYALMIGALVRLGELDRAIEVGLLALQMAKAVEDTSRQAFVTLHLAMAYRDRGDLRRAADDLRSFVETAASPAYLTGLGWPTTTHRMCHVELARTLIQLGDFDEAIAHTTESVRLCEAAGHLLGVAVGSIELGRAFLDRGDLSQALPAIERALDLCQTRDFTAAGRWAMAVRGAAHTLAGQASLAVPLLEQSLGVYGHVPATGHVHHATWLGEAYLATGRIADARQTVTSALARAEAQQMRSSRVVALRVLAEIAARGDPPNVAEAEARYCEALELAEELEMRPLQAHCHLGLGKLYRRGGRLEDARAELVIAVAMLREMGMAFWLPEAEAELAQSNASTLVEPAG
jgi:tetratricopeptide (TPR) repeat protein